MGIQIRDDRQMKALTGLSQAQFDYLLPVFSDLYQATQQKTYEEGVESGTRTRKPGGGSKGKVPVIADKWFCRKVRFLGKIQKSSVGNSMTYRLPDSRKSNFATEPFLVRAFLATFGLGRPLGNLGCFAARLFR